MKNELRSLVFFAILFIPLVSCGNDSNSPVKSPEIDLVDKEFKNGYVTVYGYGLPGPQLSFYSREFHVPLKMVGGCVVEESLASSVDIHNKLIEERIKSGLVAPNDLTEYEKYFSPDADLPIGWSEKFYGVDEEFRVGRLKLKLSNSYGSYDFRGTVLRDQSPVWIPGEKPVGKIKISQRAEADKVFLISYINEYDRTRFNNFVWVDSIGGIVLFSNTIEIK